MEIGTMTISAAQKRCIKTLVGKLNVKDSDALVLGFTGMRTDSVSDMLPLEAAAMIKHLKSLDPDEQSAELMRRKIIGMAYRRAGLARSASAAQKKAVVKWLDTWCKQYGYIKKGLNSYTHKELPKLVSQFEIVVDKLIIDL